MNHFTSYLGYLSKQECCYENIICSCGLITCEECKYLNEDLEIAENLTGALEYSNSVLESAESISKSMKYHLSTNKPLIESVYRIYSREWYRLIFEAKKLHESNIIKFKFDDDLFLFENSARTALYQGKKVALNSPKRGGPKKFYVYVDCGKRNKEGRVLATRVTFGDPNLKIRNNDPARAKSFRARHRCHEKTDKCTAGYWSCNIARYSKSLNLTSDRPW